LRVRLAVQFWIWIIGGLGIFCGAIWVASFTVCKDHPSASEAGRQYALVCEAKGTELGLLFFTYCLVVVGWFTIRNSEKTSRELERAYVSGGGPWATAPPLFPQIMGFQMTVDNYGKSPATIIEYALEICDANNIPPMPAYMRADYERVPLRATLKPQEKGLVITTRAFIRPIPNPVAYGRIWYLDIWKTPHFYSFILPADPIGSHARVSEAHESYTDWT
jgi:hypothetical protein